MLLLKYPRREIVAALYLGPMKSLWAYIKDWKGEGKEGWPSSQAAPKSKDTYLMTRKPKKRTYTKARPQFMHAVGILLLFPKMLIFFSIQNVSCQ